MPQTANCATEGTSAADLPPEAMITEHFPFKPASDRIVTSWQGILR